ncbi:MAG: GNAT family N-acetyltransferase [Clostridiaceae bacterium]
MDRLIIRKVSMGDLDRIAEIEGECFPPSEAASKESMKERILAFTDSFFVAEMDGIIVGFIDGCATNSPVIYDEMYHDTREHLPNGKNLAVFGLDVIPGYQRQGIAAKLMRHFIEAAGKAGREAVILTCKEKLVHYYEYFGFKNCGISGSTHGGVQWYDMTLTL